MWLFCKLLSSVSWTPVGTRSIRQQGTDQTGALAPRAWGAWATGRFTDRSPRGRLPPSPPFYKSREVICSGSHREEVTGLWGWGPWLGAEEGSDLWPIVPIFVQSMELAHCLQLASKGAGGTRGEITHHTPHLPLLPRHLRVGAPGTHPATHPSV